jgi:nickel-type superoxide dismutase maturation protease
MLIGIRSLFVGLGSVVRDSVPRRYPRVVAVILGLLLVAVARLPRVEVAGGSMAPTLRPGDRLVLVPGARPRPGDLVAVPDPRASHRLLVKRVVGAGPAGLELRGDAPAASTDSRAFGAVAPATVRGVAVYRYAPPDRAGWLGRGPSAGRVSRRP